MGTWQWGSLAFSAGDDDIKSLPYTPITTQLAGTELMQLEEK